MLLSIDNVGQSIVNAKSIYGDFDPYSASRAKLKLIGDTTFRIANSISDANSGTLSGRIIRASDRITPISNATIEVLKDGNVVNTSVSDANGNYSMNLPVGEYVVKISANGFFDFRCYASVEADKNTYTEAFLMITEADSESGTASGCVVNSLTGAGVDGVTLTVKKDWNNTTVSADTVKTTTTDNNGDYTLELPLGNYTVIASKDGFVTSSFNIIVQEGTTGNQNGTITPVVSGDNYYITLTWGENPRDMDSHVEGTLSNGEHFHVYYGDMTAYDGDVEVCKLDYDDTSSYGPENVTLNTTTSDTYYYYIYKFAGSGTTGSSQAHVSVKQGNREIAYFNVPTNLGDGDYWNVFAIKNGEIIPGGTITDYADLSYAE